MKLILQCHYSDEMTYSNTVDYCIEYHSEEALLCDFESALDKAYRNKRWEFIFYNINFNVDDFIFGGDKRLPTVYTLEVWWAHSHKP